MVEYPKIETLYERDEKTFKLKEPLVLKNPVYGEIRRWHFTEKIDGTNIRCQWNAAEKKLTFGGRTESAQLHNQLVKWLYENVSKDYFAENFPDCNCIVFGEGYGAGIQKAGIGYGPEKKFVVFDVMVDDKWWLNWEGVKDVSGKLGLFVVPDFGVMELNCGVDIVRCGFASRMPEAQCNAEGLVGRTIEPLFDKRGNRLIIKLKTKDFS